MEEKIQQLAQRLNGSITLGTGQLEQFLKDLNSLRQMQINAQNPDIPTTITDAKGYRDSLLQKYEITQEQLGQYYNVVQETEKES
ncbi:MAG: hypothetical protein ACOCXG_01865 [Nanoarchaeota archaeon]